jgi:hypothetical protein
VRCRRRSRTATGQIRMPRESRCRRRAPSARECRARSRQVEGSPKPACTQPGARERGQARLGVARAALTVPAGARPAGFAGVGLWAYGAASS